MIAKYFTKGKEILVNGEMQSRKWQDNDGNTRISWEIQANTVDFCGSKGNNTPTTENATQVNLDTVVDNGSDDLPF